MKTTNPNLADFEKLHYERVQYKTLRQKIQDRDLQEQEALRYRVHGHKLFPYASLEKIRYANDRGVI
jgi:hypothetical protein